MFFSGLLDRFFSLCAAVCLADVSVFVAAVSVLVLAVSTFVLLYQIGVLCQFFWLLYRCVLLAAVSACLATASGFCHFSVGFDQRPIGACLGGWAHERCHTRGPGSRLGLKPKPGREVLPCE